MRRFILSFFAAIFLIIGFSWYWVATQPMKIFDSEYGIWKAKAEMIDACDLGDLVVLGDSKPVAAVVPQKIGYNAVNLALGGARVIDILAESRRILSCPRYPRTVILSITFLSMTNSQCLWERTVKYGLLHISYKELQGFRREARRYGDTQLFGPWTPFDLDARLKSALYPAKFPAYYFSSLINSNPWERQKDNLEKYQETKEARGQHHFGMASHSEEIDGFTGADRFDPPPFESAIFAELLQLFADHNVNVYFISSPYKQVDIDRLRPKVQTDFADYLAGYEKRYPNFHVVGDLFPALSSDNFGDLAHVNPAGASVWSERLVSLLKPLDIPKE